MPGKKRVGLPQLSGRGVGDIFVEKFSPGALSLPTGQLEEFVWEYVDHPGWAPPAWSDNFDEYMDTMLLTQPWSVTSDEIEDEIE